MVDEAKVTEDGGQDVNTSDQTLKEATTTSQKTEVTQTKQDEAKQISDKKAEEGRKLKLEDLQKRLEIAEAALQKKQDEELAVAAEGIGKKPDELKALGLDTAEKVKQYADFFNAKPSETSTEKGVEPTRQFDTGKNSGSIVLPERAVDKYKLGFAKLNKK